MSTNKKRLPYLFGEPLTIPFVGAIIERRISGRVHILIQTRHKPDKDPKYTGTLEIPGGKLRAGESVFETLKREIEEEAGLELQKIYNDEILAYPNRDDSSEIFFPFCVTQMTQGPFAGFIFVCEAEGEPKNSTDEAKNIQWIDKEELRQIVKEHPEQIYTAFLGPLNYYLDQNP